MAPPGSGSNWAEPLKIWKFKVQRCFLQRGYINVHPCQAAKMDDERGMAKSGLASSIGTPVDLVGNILPYIHHLTCQDGVQNGGASLRKIRHMRAWGYVGVHKCWPEAGRGVKGTSLNRAPMKSFTRQAECLDQLSRRNALIIQHWKLAFHIISQLGAQKFIDRVSIKGHPFPLHIAEKGGSC